VEICIKCGREIDREYEPLYTTMKRPADYQCYRCMYEELGQRVPEAPPRTHIPPLPRWTPSMTFYTNLSGQLVAGRTGRRIR
jgi:hypothetical protein